VSNLKLGSENLGNFLSSPNHRRRRLAGVVASTLIHDLEPDGLYTFVLATTEEKPLLKHGRRSIFARLACDWGTRALGCFGLKV